MIKTILFDVDNTLLDFRLCSESAIKQAFQDWNLEYKPEYLDIYLEYNDHYWQMLERGEITREELYQRRWSDVFESLGIDVDGPGFERSYLKYLYTSHEHEKGAKELLDYLSKDYDLYIASNSSYDEQSGRLELAGLRDYFKGIYTSEEIGTAKPNEAFFDYICRDLDIKDKSELLMIGDSLRADIHGAKKSGLKTCWYNHAKSPLQSKEADYKVDTLDEIIKLFENEEF